MAKARAFDISTESLDANGDDESIETIMAKAKAFAEEDDDQNRLHQILFSWSMKTALAR